MARERLNPEDPKEWIRRAHSNLALAKLGEKIPEAVYEDLCFEAQQAAEKAIKALLVQRRIRFPRTHDLLDLLALLERAGLAIPDEIHQTGRLSQYAVTTRYPGPAALTRDHYTEAVDLAERVVRWAESLVKRM